MTTVPGVTVTGTPGASTGGVGVPSSSPAPTSGPNFRSTSNPTDLEQMPVRVESPPPTVQPTQISTPIPQPNYPHAKGTSVPLLNSYSSNNPPSLSTPDKDTTIIKTGGNVVSTDKPGSITETVINAENFKENPRAIPQAYQDLVSLGYTIIQPKEMAIDQSLASIGQQLKAYGGVNNIIRNEIGTGGLSLNEQTKTISFPLYEGHVLTSQVNAARDEIIGTQSPNLSSAGPSTLASSKLGSSLGQEATGYISKDSSGNVILSYSPEQTKSIINSITSNAEYGNIPNFFNKADTNTSRTPNPLLEIKQEPGGPITPTAEKLGSSLGQVRLGELVRNTPAETLALKNEALKAGGLPVPKNYTVSLADSLGISTGLKSSLTSTISFSPEQQLEKNLVLQGNLNIAEQNALAKLTLSGEIDKFVSGEAAKGVKEISIYDLATGSNLGKVQANKFGEDVINEIAQQRQIYLKDYVSPNQISEQLAKSNQARNEIVSYIGEAQTLGLKLNLIDKSGKVISTVPSESGFHSLIGAEKGGNEVSISKAAPSNTQELSAYLQKQSSLMLSNTKNNTEDQNVIDLIRGAGAGVYNIIFGLQSTLISLPQNTHAILEAKNPEFYGKNDILTTINNLLKPSPFVQNYTSKVSQPESVTEDILSLSIPKESTNYLIGEGLVEGGFAIQQLKEAGQYVSSLISKAGPVVKGLVARTVLERSDLGVKANAEEAPLSATTRTTPTFKNLNMMREPVPKDVFGLDNLERPKISETPMIPRNTLLEDISKETQSLLSGIQNKLLETNKENPVIVNKAVELDPFYKPAKNIPKLEGVSPNVSDITGSAPIDKQIITNTKTAESINTNLPASEINQVPGVTVTGQPGSSTGGVGVFEPVNTTYQNYIDRLQIPRSEIVEKTRPISTATEASELFSSSGKKLDKLFEGTSSLDPLGLRKKEVIEKTSIIEEDIFHINNPRTIEITKGEKPIEELTEVGLQRAYEYMKNKLVKPGEAVHGTDIESALNIVNEGINFKPGLSNALKAGPLDFIEALKQKPEFYVSKDINLAGFFATRASAINRTRPVFLKFLLNEKKIAGINEVGENVPIARRNIEPFKKEGFAGVERYDFGFGKFFENKKEIVTFSEEAFIGKPKIVDLSDLEELAGLKVLAHGKPPLERVFPTNEFGTTHYGEIIESREQVPIYKNTENKPIEIDPFYRNKVPMKSLGATNKISKNVPKVDTESLLNYEKVKPDLSDFMNIGIRDIRLIKERPEVGGYVEKQEEEVFINMNYENFKNPNKIMEQEVIDIISHESVHKALEGLEEDWASHSLDIIRFGNKAEIRHMGVNDITFTPKVPFSDTRLFSKAESLQDFALRMNRIEKENPIMPPGKNTLGGNPKFTETNVYLGRGIGFNISKGEGGVLTRPPPTNPPKPPKEEVPKGFKAIESGGTITLQKLEEPKVEQIIKPKKKSKIEEQVGQVVKLGTGLGLTKTGVLIKPIQKQKPKYVVIQKQKPKQRVTLITTPKQGQSQSEKLDQLVKQKIGQPQAYKQDQAQKFKQLERQALEQPQLFKQEQAPKLDTELLLSPKLDFQQPQKLEQKLIVKNKEEIPPVPPVGVFDERKRPNKNKKKKAERADFLGNVPETQIEGVYNRSEVVYGLKKINKLVGRDYSRSTTKYKAKTKKPFTRKDLKL